MIQGDTVYLYTKPPLWSPLTVRYRAIIESSHRGPQSAKNNHFRELTLAPGFFFFCYKWNLGWQYANVRAPTLSQGALGRAGVGGRKQSPLRPCVHIYTHVDARRRN